MPVLSEVQNSTFIVTLIGDLEGGQLIDAIVAGYSDPRFTVTSSILVDVRQSLANPSSEDMYQACKRILGPRPPGHRGKWAILVRNEPLRFGLGRMAAGRMGSLGVEMAVFTEMDAALRYLARP